MKFDSNKYMFDTDLEEGTGDQKRFLRRFVSVFSYVQVINDLGNDLKDSKGRTEDIVEC